MSLTSLDLLVSLDASEISLYPFPLQGTNLSFSPPSDQLFPQGISQVILLETCH